MTNYSKTLFHQKSFLLTFIILIFISCEKEPSPEHFSYYRVKVNHYQQAVPSKFVHLIQTKENIGTTTWEQERFSIENFNYEPGYMYELEVMNFWVPNSPNRTQGTKLMKVVSKINVPETTVFEVNLKVSKINLLTAKSGGGYKILNKIDLECGNLCDELHNALSNDDNIIAKVVRNKSGSYELLSFAVN